MTGVLSVSFTRTEEEKELVHAFVRGVYASAFGTAPTPVTLYAYVTRGKTIVASMGIDFAQPDEVFLTERIYKLDRTSYPLEGAARCRAHLGRLACTEPGVALLAMYAGLRFVANQGCAYALVDHQPAMHKLALRYGFSFRELHYTGMCLEAIPTHDHAYFSKGTARPYLVHIEESIAQMYTRLPQEMREVLTTD